MELLTITPQLLAMGIPQVENIIDKLPNHPTKRYAQRSMESVDTWIMHHTASEAPLINQALFHVNSRGWARIGYSIMIVDGSRIVQTNYLDAEAVHCAGWNHRSMGVCVLGDLSKRQLTARERELLLAVFVSLNAMYPGRQIKGHGECKPTSCPVISMPKLRSDIMATEMQLEQAESAPKKEEIAYRMANHILWLQNMSRGKKSDGTPATDAQKVWALDELMKMKPEFDRLGFLK
jgi:hypothetical protein